MIDKSALAQAKDSVRTGVLDGSVKDSLHNTVLWSATLAVYTVKDSSLISYQLANNFGEFHFTGLPLGIPLKIIASHTGYRSLTREFTITVKDRKVALNDLNMERVEDNLQEVVVSAVPPVRMNKDTLEFNADAFKLDSNAQVEDLLRILPGVTIWGDGTITVNGRKVNAVLVNGKPFFGSDARIATKNLPKNIVEKIQVYQRSKNDRDPLDSITEVNIRLKKGKDFGYFGKLSGGYGTHGRYETDGSFNLFSAKTQIALVGSSNNINKVANDVETLLRNSSFKGAGANMEYQPDFTTKGLNKFSSGGLVFQHDFIADPDFYKYDRVTANYFVKNNSLLLLENTRVRTSLGNGITLSQQNNINNNISGLNNSTDAKYEKRKNNNIITFNLNGSTNSADSRSESQSTSTGTAGDIESVNSQLNQKHDELRKMSLGGSLRHDNKGVFPDYQIDYSFKAGDDKIRQEYKTGFLSIVSPDQNQRFDRLYNNGSDDAEHRLVFRIGDFNPLIFGKNKLAGIVIGLQNKLYATFHNEDNTVKDKDSTAGTELLNTYLTNKSRYKTLNELPALTLDKRIYKGLMNRYLKTWSVSAVLQSQFFDQTNGSAHSFQNFTRSYRKFVPEATVNFDNRHYGEYDDKYSLSFLASSYFPTVQQLIPLVDSANQYFIQEGNARLKEQDKQDLSFKFDHSSDKGKNILFYTLSAKAGTARNYFADSSITDTLGRSIHYTVNANGYWYVNASGNLSKAFKFQNNQLQVSLFSSVVYSRNPNYVNSVFNLSRNLTTYNRIGLYFTARDWLALNFQQDFNAFNSKQKSLAGGEISNSQKSTLLSVSVNITKRLSTGSNITYTQNSSIGAPSTNFTIWNANASYRMLKGNNAEIKFSAMDLLHQNTGVINYGFNNSSTYGTTNVLQQYFMLTLTYFPRKFGRKGNNP